MALLTPKKQNSKLIRMKKTSSTSPKTTMPLWQTVTHALLILMRMALLTSKKRNSKLKQLKQRSSTFRVLTILQRLRPFKMVVTRSPLTQLPSRSSPLRNTTQLLRTVTHASLTLTPMASLTSKRPNSEVTRVRTRSFTSRMLMTLR